MSQADTIYTVFISQQNAIIDNTFVSLRIAIDKVPFIVYYVLTSLVKGFEIDARLLEVLVGFEGVILTLAIPLSYQVVANISERYNSATITELFNKKFVVKWFPLILVVTILFTVILTLFCATLCTNPWWRLLVMVSLLLFVGIMVILIMFLNVLTRYISDTDAVLEEHFVNAEKFLK